MEKEDVVKELKQKAKETTRLERKSKQFLFIAIPLFFIFISCWMLIAFHQVDSYNGMLLGSAGIVFLCLLILSGVILPIGKISGEKVEKYFKDKLSQKIKDDEEELVRVSERKDELKEELKILKEL